MGLNAISPGAGATLRLLAAAGNARAVVEIGTGTGGSGVWLLRGMRGDGVLTSRAEVSSSIADSSIDPLLAEPMLSCRPRKVL